MSASGACGSSAGRRLRIAGVVQGVGFRPFVHRIAREEKLAGSVRNDAGGVVVEAWGEPAALARLRRRIESEAPGAAQIRELREEPLGSAGPSGFAILGSASDAERCVSIAAGPRALRRVPRRAARRLEPPFRLRVHELHRVRAALHDRAGHSLGPRQHDDGALHDVRCLSPRVRRPGRPPLPRTAERLPRLRAAARLARRSGRAPRDGRRDRGRLRRARSRAHRGAARARRLPPCVRRHQLRSGQAPARAKAARGEALRGDGGRPRRRARPRAGRRRQRRGCCFRQSGRSCCCEPVPASLCSLRSWRRACRGWGSCCPARLSTSACSPLPAARS